MNGAFEERLSGSIMPFGAMVEYHPISSKDQARLHQFAETSFLRHLYGLRSMFGGGIWLRDLLVADVDGL